MIVGRIDRLRVASGLDDARILADQFSARVVNKDRFFRAGDLVNPFAVTETNWLTNEPTAMNSVLISSQGDGFTAVLLRGTEPTVVRSVTCAPSEMGDEIYRLLMFYNDRFSDAQGGNLLSRLLLSSAATSSPKRSGPSRPKPSAAPSPSSAPTTSASTSPPANPPATTSPPRPRLLRLALTQLQKPAR
jgi:hypothetical protein